MEMKLKLKYRQGGKGKYGSTGAGGAGTKRIKATLFRGEREQAQEATTANRTVKVLGGNGKIRWQKLS